MDIHLVWQPLEKETTTIYLVVFGLLSYRKAAAMAMYRDIEEAWERMQEEKESTKRIEAAKRKLEHEVLVSVL